MSETQIVALKLFEPEYEETSVFVASHDEVTKNEMMSSKWKFSLCELESAKVSINFSRRWKLRTQIVSCLIKTLENSGKLFSNRNCLL